ncbi:MAG: hypothetical protein CMI54_04650 [Parcubacteria group bacterium]|nr:hypothetical protein [Parcubacteria group bacterium]
MIDKDKPLSWLWVAFTGFLTISGWVSGFALSNGLSQQEHRLLEQRIKVVEDERAVTRRKFERLSDKLDLIHQKQSEIYLDE